MNDQLLIGAYRLKAELARERAAAAKTDILRKWLLDVAKEFDRMAAALERKFDLENSG